MKQAVLRNAGPGAGPGVVDGSVLPARTGRPTAGDRPVQRAAFDDGQPHLGENGAVAGGVQRAAGRVEYLRDVREVDPERAVVAVDAGKRTSPLAVVARQDTDLRSARPSGAAVGECPGPPAAAAAALAEDKVFAECRGGVLGEGLHEPQGPGLQRRHARVTEGVRTSIQR